jgi:hypothetical protein
MKILFKKQITGTFYQPDAYVFYFFQDSCTILDLKQMNLYDIKQSFPKIIKCHILKNGLFLLLAETDSLGGDFRHLLDSSFNRTFLTFNIKSEQFEVPTELQHIFVLDFIIMNNLLLLLSGTTLFPK